MGKHFKLEHLNDGIAVISFFRTDADANALNEDVLLELNSLIDIVTADKTTKGLIFESTRPKQFIAGADIKLIERFESAAAATDGSRRMQAIFTKISSLPFSTVAAIHGACLGGGLELALACRWRVVSDDPSTALALPEIQLGLIPGAGGTQRLPRLIGIQAGLDMVLTGKRIAPEKAVKMGLADACVHPNQLLAIAKTFALKKGRHPERKRSFSEIALERNPLGRQLMLKKAREMVEKNTKGFYPAAYKGLDAVFKGFERSLEKGLELEAQYFGELVVTRESQSLIHLFHATTAIKKHPYKDAGKERFGDSNVSLVGIVGAGFMGAGIATVCADKNIRVRLSDPSKASLGKALVHVRDYFKKKLKRRRIKSFEMDQRLNMVSPGLSTEGFKSCDIVIEAVFEELKIKQAILKQMEADAPKDWIFASNTSAIPIKKIAEVAVHPERVLGMHFFSPVEKMPLLEIVVTDQTAPWATARAIELGQTLGKQVIVVKDGPGFYTTRALVFYLNESAQMLVEGARIDKLDKALTDFGFPVGPLTLMDEVGFDVCDHILEGMSKTYPDRVHFHPGSKKVLTSGRLGRKNQKGFYTYSGGVKGEPDQGIYDTLAPYKTAPKGLPSDEMVDRCLMAFINESARCLEESILPSAYEGDVGLVFGLGFPPFWGGPFRYIDHIGATAVVERLKSLEQRYGLRFKPAAILEEHARNNKLFFPEEKHR